MEFRLDSCQKEPLRTTISTHNFTDEETESRMIQYPQGHIAIK